jgi:TPR repeat protein
MRRLAALAPNAVLGLTLAPCLPSAARSDPFAEAVKAYHAGDDETDADICRLLAEQGDADAQVNLGVSYAKGEGVPQDDAEVARWYRRAAEQGGEDGSPRPRGRAGCATRC